MTSYGLLITTCMEIEQLGCCPIKNIVLLAKLKLPTCIFVPMAIPGNLALRKPDQIITKDNYKNFQTSILGKAYTTWHNVNSGGGGAVGGVVYRRSKTITFTWRKYWLLYKSNCKQDNGIWLHIYWIVKPLSSQLLTISLNCFFFP